MTNHWRDIKNADVILITGANPGRSPSRSASSGSCARSSTRPRDRATAAARSSSTSIRGFRARRRSPTCTLRIRTGTDVAFFGGLMNYVLQNNLPPRRLRHALHQCVVHRQGRLRLPGRPVHRVRSRHSGRTTRDDVGVRHRRGRVREARHDAAESALRLPAHEAALRALHAARWSQSITGIPKDDFLKVAADRRRDGPPRQGHDDRLRGRSHAPHDRHATDPLRRGAAAPARQHGTSGRRDERRARSRQHPRQHRQRDLVGHPAGLPRGADAGPEDASTTTSKAARRRSSIRIPGTSSGRTTRSSW